MRRYLIALLTLLGVAGAAVAQEKAPVHRSGLPETVDAHIRDMVDACKRAAGKPVSDPTVEHGHLAAELEFWAINEATFQCEDAASYFSGSGGAQVLVYLSVDGGPATQAFTHGAYAMTIEHVGDLSRIWLGVGGQVCGQAGRPTHAQAIHCDRPLNWDARARTLDFAPLADIRSPDHAASAAPKTPTAAEKIAYDSGAELENPKTYVFREYWPDKADRLNWKTPLAERGKVYNSSFPSADGRLVFMSMLQSPAVCEPLCPIRMFTGRHEKILDALVCSDRTQHGVSADHRSFIACGEVLPVPQVDERTAIMQNAPPSSDPVAFVDVVRRQRSRPIDAPKPIHVDSASHNNSQMLISEWKDGAVEITYDVPRPGLPVAQGTLLFQGNVRGGRYSGTAYAFKTGCAPAPYAVTGMRDDKRNVIVLTGAAPRRDPRSCELVGESDRSALARLVFDTREYSDE